MRTKDYIEFRWSWWPARRWIRWRMTGARRYDARASELGTVRRSVYHRNPLNGHSISFRVSGQSWCPWEAAP